jgi:hypothetical protein
MTYNTTNGASGFGLTLTGGTFKLQNYMDKTGNSITNNTVNCYDQAAAVFTLGRILGIGVVYACSNSFGFINEVILVGNINTNNPFFSGSSPLFSNNALVNLTNATTNSTINTYRKIYDVNNGGVSVGLRSSFRNHAFVMLGNNVYDACAGPICSMSLSDYFSSVIDIQANKDWNSWINDNSYDSSYLYHETISDLVNSVSNGQITL